MGRTETPTPRTENCQVDQVVRNLHSKLTGKLKHHPDFKEAMRQSRSGNDASFKIPFADGFYEALIPAKRGDVDRVSLVKVIREADGLHREVVNVTAEKPLFGIWKVYDLPQLSYEQDGKTVFGLDAAQKAEEIIDNFN